MSSQRVGEQSVRDVDLNDEGRIAGFACVPKSTPESPFGKQYVPIMSMKKGSGPTILLMGGCHGDEYEGQVAVMRIWHRVATENVEGQIIFLPAANTPAVEAGSRCSPIDGENLNTAFMGSGTGNTTGAIARFIEDELISRADVIVDLHAGGNAVEYTPSGMVQSLKNPGQMQRLLDVVDIIGLPICFVVDREDQRSDGLAAVCEREGRLYFAAELGGGGTVLHSAVDMIEAGILNLLGHMGVVERAPAVSGARTEFFRRLPLRSTICAPESGVFEPCVRVGERVRENQLAGRIHLVGRPWEDPIDVRFDAGGIVLCRRVPARTERGDGLFKLGVRWERDFKESPPDLGPQRKNEALRER